jgi:hypothetical protein
VLGGLMLLNRQQNGAKMRHKQREEQNEDMRGLTQYILLFLSFSKTLTPAKRR